MPVVRELVRPDTQFDHLSGNKLKDLKKSVIETLSKYCCLSRMNSHAAYPILNSFR